MFSSVKRFRYLPPTQAQIRVVPIRRLLGLIALVAVWNVAPAARAATITENTAGTQLASTGVFYGQSVTTPAGGPWTNITLNFYDYATSAPYAIGNIYLLSQEYLGTPQALSNSTSGYIASAAASGGFWVFAPSVTLQSGTQYWFYMDTATNTTTFGSNSDPYAGGNSYAAFSADYINNPGNDKNFTLSGTPVPGPLPGAGLLSYLVVGFGGAAAFRRKLRARAASLCAVVRLRRKMTTAQLTP